MGVKLSDLISKKEISFEDLKGKKIAVDASNSLYQFISSIRQRDGTALTDSKGAITSHLIGLFSRTANLMTKGVKLCYVFDGKPPALKFAEKERRNGLKEVAMKQFKAAEKNKDIASMLKYSRRLTKITPEIIKESKELIQALGLPVIQAPSEADAQSAFMCEKGDVWAVASSDYDSLLQGAPRLITNLTLSQKRKLASGGYISITPELIGLKKALKNLKLNQDQLIALGILVGTDYNIGGIKGIGPKTALKLVQQTKNFDKLFKEVNAEFNWKKIFAIFKSMPVMKNYQLKWKPIDEEAVKKLLIKKHEFSEERVQKTLDRLQKRNKERSQTGLGDFS